MAEVLNGGFDDAGENSYPLIDRRPDRQSRTKNRVPPFRPLQKRGVVDRLPIEARARRHANGRYRN